MSFITILFPTFLNAAINSNIKLTPSSYGNATPEKRIMNRITSSYGYAISYGKDLTDLETKILEWRKNAAKQIEQIDKEIQKLQERKNKINTELEAKILKERNKISGYGNNTNETFKVSFSVINGYSMSSSIIEVNKEGIIKIIESRRMGKNPYLSTKTEKLTTDEFNNLKSLITNANIFTLEDTYYCTEFCPTDVSDLEFAFTINGSTKIIKEMGFKEIPTSLSNIKTELIRLRDKYNKNAVVSYGYGDKNTTNIENTEKKTLFGKIKNFFKK